MASCITEQWSGDYCPQVELTVTEYFDTGTQVILAWELKYITHGGYTAITNVNNNYKVIIDGDTVADSSVDINGKTTFVIASGTKTVTKTSNTQTISFSCEFSFQITWSGIYGGIKTANGTIDIPVLSTYTICFNGNGATGGSMDDAVLTYGEESVLPPNNFLRENYDFVGWASFPTTNAIYDDGATVINLSSGADITLYAVWEHKLFKNKKVYIKTSDGVKSYRTMVFDGTNWLYYKSNVGFPTNVITVFALDNSVLDGNAVLAAEFILDDFMLDDDCAILD
jgi:hypothetical protein